MLEHDQAPRSQMGGRHAQRRGQIAIIIRGIEKDKIAIGGTLRAQEIPPDQLTRGSRAAMRDVLRGHLQGLDGHVTAVYQRL